MLCMSGRSLHGGKGVWEARFDWAAVIEHMYGYINISKSLSDGHSSDGEGEGR